MFIWRVPLYLTVLVSFVVSVLWVHRLRERPWLFQHFISWPLIASVAFQAIVLTPLQSFQFKFHHDWALGYLIDPDLHPAVDSFLTLWTLTAALLNFGACLLGHWLARMPFEKPKMQIRKHALISAGVIALVVAVLLRNELLHIGEYDEFFAGDGKLLLLTPTGLMGLVELGLSGAFVWYAPKYLDLIPRESANLF